MEEINMPVIPNNTEFILLDTSALFADWSEELKNEIKQYTIYRINKYTPEQTDEKKTNLFNRNLGLIEEYIIDSGNAPNEISIDEDLRYIQGFVQPRIGKNIVVITSTPALREGISGSEDLKDRVQVILLEENKQSPKGSKSDIAGNDHRVKAKRTVVAIVGALVVLIAAVVFLFLLKGCNSDIKLNNDSVLLEVGETVLLEPTKGKLPKEDLIWTSYNPNVASVENDGTVTAKSVGIATIVVIQKNGRKSATCVVNVVERSVAISEIKLDQDDISLAIGDSKQLVATVIPDNATKKTLIWTSTNPSVASVDESG